MMSRKFSDTQKRYLQWLLDGNSIHVLLECFTNIGKLTYSSRLPFKPDKRALEGLKKAGMLKFHDETQFGLRWSVVSISDKGIEFMEGQE